MCGTISGRGENKFNLRAEEAICGVYHKGTRRRQKDFINTLGQEEERVERMSENMNQQCNKNYTQKGKTFSVYSRSLGKAFSESAESSLGKAPSECEKLFPLSVSIDLSS